jgi:methanol metabolism-related c-type cytochrome
MLARGMMVAALTVAAGVLPGWSAAAQEGPGDAAPASDDAGKYYDEDGDPTFKIEPDGTVDWYIYSGFRRYHSECHVCHGPDGEGSSYAPRLVDSIKRLPYPEFLEVVTNGRSHVDQGQQSVMPAFGTNVNVMCYVDDIYIYLRARAQGDLPRGRPAKRADKPEAFTEAESACLGT